MSLINLFSSGKNVIVYRPEVNAALKNTEATLLLNQIIYWWSSMDEQPFYKFKEPCSHELYKKGSSWVEETGFTVYGFEKAVKCLVDKGLITVTQKRIEHLTYYDVLEENVLSFLAESFKSRKTSPSRPTKPEGNVSGQATLTSRTYSTETTTETTTDSFAKPDEKTGLPTVKKVYQDYPQEPKAPPVAPPPPSRYQMPEKLKTGCEESTNEIYSKSWPEYFKLFGLQHKSLNEYHFQRWKEFVEFVRGDGRQRNFEDVFKASRFIQPDELRRLMTEKGFLPETWEPVLVEMCGGGIEHKHNLYFRLEQYINYFYEKQKKNEQQSVTKPTTTDRNPGLTKLIQRGKERFEQYVQSGGPVHT